MESSVVQPAALQCAQHAGVDQLTVMEGFCRQACSAAKFATCLAEFCFAPFFRSVSTAKTKIVASEVGRQWDQPENRLVSFVRACANVTMWDNVKSIEVKWSQVHSSETKWVQVRHHSFRSQASYPTNRHFFDGPHRFFIESQSNAVSPLAVLQYLISGCRVAKPGVLQNRLCCSYD